MESEREGLKPRPGLKVAVTVGGRRTEGQVLNPVHAGCPEGLWWVLFDDGMAETFMPGEMEAAE